MSSRCLVTLPGVVAIAVVTLGACGGDDASDATSSAGSEPGTATVAPVSTDDPGDTTSPAPGPASTAPPISRPPITERPDVTLELAPTGASTPGVPVGPDASSNLQGAVTDLATRLDVDPSVVRVVSEENVTWRDGSIGCPQPGVNYLQSLVDGVRIVLDVDGVRYSYHTGGNRPLFYCADPQLPGD